MAMTQAQIDTYNSNITDQIAQNRNGLNDLGMTISTLNSQIDSLQKAISDAQNEVTAYNTFKGNLEKSMSAVSTKSFIGDNRTKVEAEHTTRTGDVSTEISGHNANISTMQAKLADLQSQAGTINGEIANVTQAIANLENSYIE
jgi:prefoldin subunit 5